MLRSYNPSLTEFEQYTCKIESLTGVEQKRSQALAMESIKRAFRSMFKRGKKSKQEEQRQVTTASRNKSPARQTNASNTRPPAAPPKDVAPVQDKPVEPNTTGKLPPTHPLATGRHDEAQSAIPLDHGARAPLSANPSPNDTTRREEHVQPTNTLANTTTSSEPVSAISREERPAPPPKVDGAADAVVAAPMEAAVAAPAGMPMGLVLIINTMY